MLNYRERVRLLTEELDAAEARLCVSAEVRASYASEAADVVEAYAVSCGARPLDAERRAALVAACDQASRDPAVNPLAVFL